MAAACWTSLSIANHLWSDRELKTLIVKSTYDDLFAFPWPLNWRQIWRLINLLSLLLLSLSSLIFSPVLLQPASSDMQMRTKVIGMWYNVLLSWPVFVVCFWVNVSWRFEDCGTSIDPPYCYFRLIGDPTYQNGLKSYFILLIVTSHRSGAHPQSLRKWQAAIQPNYSLRSHVSFSSATSRWYPAW